MRDLGKHWEKELQKWCEPYLVTWLHKVRQRQTSAAKHNPCQSGRARHKRMCRVGARQAPCQN